MSNELKELTAEEIFGFDDKAIEPVEVPEWKGKVYVRSISAGERGKILADAASYKEGKGKPTFMQEFEVNFCILAACDSKGNSLFKPEHKSGLLGRNGAPVSRIAAKAQKMAGMTKEDLEALEKNSKTTQSEDSDSD